MRYNLNSGYGALLAHSLHGKAAGKLFIVGKSAIANRAMYTEMFGGDPDGVLRFAATIDAAVGLCTASGADRIFVLPGHTETLSSATALAMDVAGVQVIGLGAGSNRPTITLDTAATSTIAVSADDVAFENIIFSANYADITSLFTLTTAANFTLRNCYFKATATAMNFLNIVDTGTTSNDCDGLTIEGCKWIEPDTATLSLVKMDGSNADVVIRDNFVQLGVKNNTAALMAIATGKIATNAQITDNRVFRLNTDTATGAILVTTDGSTNSGIIARNFVQHADTAAELLITASSGFGTFENYASGVAGASGYLLPGADS